MIRPYHHSRVDLANAIAELASLAAVKADEREVTPAEREEAEHG